ncbi:MAG: hypothetical protein L6R42_001958 [Xanthoria sp. 1 TBL-2021]|nr:MAG: hypothetical protein L6R42_001958 [Xanthoria sp. 1 TBL-2021]
MDQKITSYRVDPLMVTEPIPAKVIENFKSLRLEALRVAPPSYLSTLEREEKPTDAQWKARILDPTHHYLICHKPLSPTNNTVSDSESAAGDWAENDAWVGMLYLLGPYNLDGYAVTSLVGSAAMETDGDEIGWYINGIYLQPNSRCEASATAIHEAILEYLRFQTDEYLPTVFNDATGLEKPKRARLAGTIRNNSDQLEALYESLAGRHVGWADTKLRRRIAGLDDLPDMEPMGQLRMRVMERVIEC